MRGRRVRTQIKNQPDCALTQFRGVLPRCWHWTILRWVQRLHQSRGDSVSLRDAPMFSNRDALAQHQGYRAATRLPPPPCRWSLASTRAGHDEAWLARRRRRTARRRVHLRLGPGDRHGGLVRLRSVHPCSGHPRWSGHVGNTNGRARAPGIARRSQLTTRARCGELSRVALRGQSLSDAALAA